MALPLQPKPHMHGPEPLRRLCKLAIASVVFALITVGCGPSQQADGDGGPEGSTPGACDATEFECANKECIPASLKCNTFPNCTDSSDEEGCGDKCNGPDDFRCRDGAMASDPCPMRSRRSTPAAAAASRRA